MDLSPHPFEIIDDGGRKPSVVEEVDDAGLQGRLFASVLPLAVPSEAECTRRGCWIGYGWRCWWRW